MLSSVLLRHAALDQSPVVLIFFASLSVVSLRISSLEDAVGRLGDRFQYSRDDDERSRGSSSNMSSFRAAEVAPYEDTAP